MLRLFKSASGLKYFNDYASDEFELRKLKLRNAFFKYFECLFRNEQEQPFFIQVVRALSSLLVVKVASDK